MRGEISLERVFKHSGERGFLYLLIRRGGKSLSRECLNTPAREVFYTLKKRREISLARVFKHSGERGFLYFLEEGGNLSRESV